MNISAGVQLPDETLIYKCQRWRQKTNGSSDKWHFGAAPFRVSSSSHPAQRRKNDGGERISDENKDCLKRVESYGIGDKNSIQSPNGIAGRGNQFFNMTPSAFCHDNLNLHTGSKYPKQQTPLQEITMNHRSPAFKNIYQDTRPKHGAGLFECSPTVVNEQEPFDLFHYSGDACYRSPKSFDVSPTRSSVFSKDSDSSEFSSSSCLTNDFLKFPERNFSCLEELGTKSLECLNISTNSVEKLWGDVYRNQLKKEKLIKEDRPHPETPESDQGRIFSPESVYRGMSFLNEEHGDFSDDAFRVSPMQVAESSLIFDFSNNASQNFKSQLLPQEYEKRSNFFQDQERTGWHPNIMPFCQELKSYLTDPDEEYAKMSSSSAPMNFTQ